MLFRSHRLSIHLSSTSLSNKTHKNNWIKSLLILDIIPIITLIEEASDECWVEREIFWIKYYRDSGFNLTNSTDGGEGMLNPSEDTRNKLSFASSGDRNPNYGKKRTKEINDKKRSFRGQPCMPPFADCFMQRCVFSIQIFPSSSGPRDHEGSVPTKAAGGHDGGSYRPDDNPDGNNGPPSRGLGRGV